MIKENITPAEVVSFLNKVVLIDPNFIKNLIEQRVECNQQIAKHPTIQVHLGILSDKDGKTSAGFLGVLNGLFGIAKDGFGCIAAIFEVICPQGHKSDGVVGDLCLHCGEKLLLGKVEKFQVIRKVGE